MRSAQYTILSSGQSKCEMCWICPRARQYCELPRPGCGQCGGDSAKCSCSTVAIGRVALEEPDPAWQAGSIVHREFLRIHYEHLTQLQAETTFLITMTDQQAQAFFHDPILKNLPSIQRKQVYGLGENSFRIDLFSAREIINSLLRRFAGEQAQSLVMP